MLIIIFIMNSDATKFFYFDSPLKVLGSRILATQNTIKYTMNESNRIEIGMCL